MSKSPGFSSEKAWKNGIAVIGYLIIALVVIAIITGKDSSTSITTTPVKSSAATSTGTSEPDGSLLISNRDE